MDRKAWIVVSLCLIGIIFNFWWQIQHAKDSPPLPVPPAIAENQSAAATATSSTGTPAPGTPAAATTAPVAEEIWILKNDQIVYTFTSQGGGILTAELLDTHDNIVLNKEKKAAVGSLSTKSRAYGDLNYAIVEKSDQHVIFEVTTPEKIKIRKAYRFLGENSPSAHLLDLNISFTNIGEARFIQDYYYLYTGSASSLNPDEIETPAFVYNNAGDADYENTGQFRDGAGMFGMGSPIQVIEQEFDRYRWAGVMSRFYTTLISSKADIRAKTWTERFLVDHSNSSFKDHPKAGQDYGIHGAIGLPLTQLEPGSTQFFDLQIYMGAKIYRDLNAIDQAAKASDSPDRQHRFVMFYGMFSFVSRFLVYWLRQFHDWTGNWGYAIIILTFCVRSILWPVQARSNKVMKRMGLLSPMLKELQEKHKDDPQRLNSEMMKLYREYGVNPMGGCLPILIQIPIFFGFYSVLRYAAELRGEPWIAWVKDLSMPDTITTITFPFSLPLMGNDIDINPLPILMGVTMFLQMKLTPQPQATDKMQQRIFMLMPFLFLFFCYNFASALALYWTGQNIFSIFQAQLTRLWQKDITLEKVTVLPPTNSSSAGLKKKGIAAKNSKFGGSQKPKK